MAKRFAVGVVVIAWIGGRDPRNTNPVYGKRREWGSASAASETRADVDAARCSRWGTLDGRRDSV